MSRQEDLERLLESECKEIGAASCTFYARDPYWSDEFRLICMPGVLIREPMYGWIYDEESKAFFCDGGPERFCLDIPSEFPPEQRGFEILPGCAQNHLFSSFADREGVKSFARFHHLDEVGEIDAVMFLNFRENKTFDEGAKERLRGTLQHAMSMLPEVVEELRRLDAEHVAELLRIIRLTQEMTGLIQVRDDGISSVHSQLTRLLQSSLEALRIPPDAGIGTIHFYNPDEYTTELVVMWPESDLEQDQHNVRLCDSLLSWIVVMRRPVLIDDIYSSKFNELHRSLPKRESSILAVPMLVNGDVVGVLTLASTRKNDFHPVSVRSIWHAANSVAFSLNSARVASTTRLLLKIGQDATANEEGAKTALFTIAELLNEALAADSCDIWHFNSFLGRFESAASLEDTIPIIRSDGWTKYVWKTKQPVWIAGIKSEADFSAHYWRDGWSEAPSSNTFPSPVGVSREAIDRDIGAQLGLPILVSDECAGVAWIKYFADDAREPIRPPYDARMAEVFSVASQAGLVLELVQRQIEGADRSQLRVISEKLKPYSESCPLHFFSLPIEGHIIHKPFHALVCGDFHVISKVDASVVGLLIGDGEGKAVTGLLNALPLITGFEAFGAGSGSTRHVVDRLSAVSRKLGLKGTALYWTFTSIQKDIWLAMTSAGHVRPILIRNGANPLPNDDGNPALGTPLGIDLDSPQMEHLQKLFPGDILVAFTDGVSEAFSPGEGESEQTAMGRIIAVCYQNPELSCAKLAEKILSEAERSSPFSDDATICVIRYLPASQRR